MRWALSRPVGCVGSTGVGVVRSGYRHVFHYMIDPPKKRNHYVGIYEVGRPHRISGAPPVLFVWVSWFNFVEEYHCLPN